jgi:hypothetical protein
VGRRARARQVGMFREVLALKRNREKDKRIPFFRSINWSHARPTGTSCSPRRRRPRRRARAPAQVLFRGVHLLLVRPHSPGPTFHFWVEVVTFGRRADARTPPTPRRAPDLWRRAQNRINVVHLELPFVGILSDHHLFKAFCLWVCGFMAFILSLEKGSYKYQFTQFSWTHMTLLMVVVSASCMINNMYGGMIYFYLPVCLVIWNDVYAYVFGRFYGKTPLIKLSPKKTWEGFLGAFVTTVVFGWWGGYLLAFFPSMVCPQVRPKPPACWSGASRT